MGGDFRQLGGDFLAKALEPEGPPPAQETPLILNAKGSEMCITTHFIHGIRQPQGFLR